MRLQGAARVLGILARHQADVASAIMETLGITLDDLVASSAERGTDRLLPSLNDIEMLRAILEAQLES
jgi:hypothetical protein